MNLWKWLRRIFHRKGQTPPRTGMETYEQTIHVEQQDITNLIHKIAEHEQRSDEDVENEILSHAIEQYAHFEETRVKWNALSFREQEVVALSCLRYTNEDIAKKLVISPNTVKAHTRSIQQKFNVRGKEELRRLFRGWDFSAFDR